jgi:membrane associated rhomboid family serine protease
MPLVRNAVIFVARYALAVAAAFAATATAHAQLVAWDVAVSGLATGYFVGWLARFARARRTAEQP